MILTGQKLIIDGDFAPANRSPFLNNHHGCKIELLYEGFDSQRMKTPVGQLNRLAYALTNSDITLLVMVLNSDEQELAGIFAVESVDDQPDSLRFRCGRGLSGVMRCLEAHKSHVFLNDGAPSGISLLLQSA